MLKKYQRYICVPVSCTKSLQLFRVLRREGRSKFVKPDRSTYIWRGRSQLLWDGFTSWLERSVISNTYIQKNNPYHFPCHETKLLGREIRSSLKSRAYFPTFEWLSGDYRLLNSRPWIMSEKEEKLTKRNIHYWFIFLIPGPQTVDCMLLNSP